MEAWAVLVAAGRGTRLGLPYNKVFYPFLGRAVFLRTLDALLESGCFAGIVLVLSEQDRDAFDLLTSREMLPLLKAVATGGETRQGSVLNGLKRVPESAELVAIHDAARPFASPALIRSVVESAQRHGSGVAATRIQDTVKTIDEEGRAFDTPDRAKLRAVQTPQAFSRTAIMLAHQRALEDGYTATDDAQLMERYIGPVHLVETPDGERNRKITTKEDIRIMEAMAAQNQRVGSGYDVHRLVPGRKLILCGVDVPYELGLLGHSDADVAVHALMDALLGAMGEGDIGRHFPDSDARYKGISSMELLDRVMERLRARGGWLVNADVTIVAQRPKLAPFIHQMANNLCAAMGAPIGRVNVKATTTEGLGFEGRGEGISAMASVLVALNA